MRGDVAVLWTILNDLRCGHVIVVIVTNGGNVRMCCI